MTTSAPRFAVYFAPHVESPLWRFGSAVIGYDAASGSDRPHIALHGFDAGDWARLTEEPRRYGFHATLKAPFRLKQESAESALVADLDTLAASLAPVTLAPLAVCDMGRFCALGVGVGERHDDVTRLSSAIVTALEPHRAQLTETELARRLATPLTNRQIASLQRFGYPYVFEDFRFHMTLTGPLPADRHHAALMALSAAFEAHVPPEPVTIDSLCLFRQARPDARFSIVHRVPLSGPR